MTVASLRIENCCHKVGKSGLSSEPPRIFDDAFLEGDNRGLNGRTDLFGDRAGNVSAKTVNGRMQSICSSSGELLPANCPMTTCPMKGSSDRSDPTSTITATWDSSLLAMARAPALPLIWDCEPSCCGDLLVEFRKLLMVGT